MPDETISFAGFHLPGLKAGTITLSASLEFVLTGMESVTFASPELTLLVSGPRFVFSPAEVYAVFPPRDSFGEFDNVLPHIELQPSTLPWQRESGASNALPWLALILLQEDEWSDTSKVETKQLSWEALRDTVGLAREVTDTSPTQDKPYPPVKALWIQKTFLQQIFPAKDDFPWLTHVRSGHNQQGQSVERAVVVCNRMPRAGARATVHLISLEGRLTKSGDIDLTKGAAQGKIPLLSLYSWQFTCPDNEQFKVSDRAIGRLAVALRAKVEKQFPAGEARDTLYRDREAFQAALSGPFNQTEKNILVNACHIQTETFKGLMDSLEWGWLHVPRAESRGGLFNVGAVPLALGLRDGGKSVAWYHGPLIADTDLGTQREEKLLATLPVRNADQLLLYNPTTRMLDSSYAAAWELGRLLTISEPNVSQQVAEWKTSHAREAALAEQNLWFSHIPFTDSDFAHREGGQLEQQLQHYFADLTLLKGVPFHYLISHESLLPDESLRFFSVDSLWIECLLDGAFSIGRTTRYDREREKADHGRLQFPHKYPRPIMTGILLRSDLVSGWPSLVVEGYRTAEIDDQSKLDVLRFEQLGPNVLLVLFAGVLRTVALHLPPESLHFGFSRPINIGGKYFKELKNLEDGTELTTATARTKIASVDLGWRSDPSLRIVDPAKLVENINRNIRANYSEEQYQIQHSGHFAVELLEGTPRLIVTLVQR